MPFGQLVIGPPGSGKTTYCNGMQQFLQLAGRKVAVINLDPASEDPPYEAAADVRDLVCLQQVQESLGLGPNGGLVYCMDYLQENLDWLDEQLQPLLASNHYIIFDLPGQVELFTLHPALQRLATHLAAPPHSLRLAAVHCVDAHLCSDAGKFVAALMLSLSTMLHLELPHVNVLSKIDLIEQYGGLSFGLDYYCEVQDLSQLQHAMGSGPFSQRFRKLTAGLCEVIEEYGLLSFAPLAIEDRDTVARVVALVDQANGYAYSRLSEAGRDPYATEFGYAGAEVSAGADMWAALAGKYLHPTVGEDGTAGEEVKGVAGAVLQDVRERT